MVSVEAATQQVIDRGHLRSPLGLIGPFSRSISDTHEMKIVVASVYTEIAAFCGILAFGNAVKPKRFEEIRAALLNLKSNRTVTAKELAEIMPVITWPGGGKSADAMSTLCTDGRWLHAHLDRRSPTSAKLLSFADARVRRVRIPAEHAADGVYTLTP